MAVQCIVCIIISFIFLHFSVTKAFVSTVLDKREKKKRRKREKKKILAAQKRYFLSKCVYLQSTSENILYASSILIVVMVQ